MLRKMLYDGPDSGYGVRKEYANRINAFFNRIKDGNHSKLGVNDSPLDALFAWAEEYTTSSRTFKAQRDNEVQARVQARRQAETTISNLRDSLAATERDLSKANETIRKERMENSKRVEDLVLAHSIAEANWAEKTKTAKSGHDKEINRLLGQLLDNQDDIQKWTDDKIKSKFRELQRRVEAMTSSNRSELKIPPNRTLSYELDPSGFYPRYRGRLHVLLKSIIWNILYDQFFASPFGFGALGPDEGKKVLLRDLSERQKLLQGGSTWQTSDGNLLAIFETDKLANTWRSSTFQSIIAATADDESQISRLLQGNIQATVKRIWAVFNEVTELSDSIMPKGFERDVLQLTRLVAELAFQFGVHPAHLLMRVPAKGEKVHIGLDYQDCENGDSDRGKRFEVDLVVLPGLQKIGDGRTDMDTVRTIVPCEIWPSGV